METSVLTSIVAGTSALLGVALTSALQARTQRHNHFLQLSSEVSKRKSDLKEQEKKLALERLTKAHRQLSMIAREFSLTSLDIIWRAEMTDAEYDQRYLSLCEEIDDLRITAELYESTLHEDVEKIHGNMNIYWGNFKNVLHLTHLGNKIDHTTFCFQQAHAMAIKIGEQAQSLKRKISALSQKYKTDG